VHKHKMKVEEAGGIALAGISMLEKKTRRAFWVGDSMTCLASMGHPFSSNEGSVTGWVAPLRS
jgi:hypothetical protein